MSACLCACRPGLCTAASPAAWGEVWAGYPQGSCRILSWPCRLCGRLHGSLLPRAGQGKRPHHQCHQVCHIINGIIDSNHTSIMRHITHAVRYAMASVGPLDEEVYPPCQHHQSRHIICAKSGVPCHSASRHAPSCWPWSDVAW